MKKSKRIEKAFKQLQACVYVLREGHVAQVELSKDLVRGNKALWAKLNELGLECRGPVAFERGSWQTPHRTQPTAQAQAPVEARLASVEQGLTDTVKAFRATNADIQRALGRIEGRLGTPGSARPAEAPRNSVFDPQSDDEILADIDAAQARGIALKDVKFRRGRICPGLTEQLVAEMRAHQAARKPQTSGA